MALAAFLFARRECSIVSGNEWFLDWICGAHAVLDTKNDYDREMLNNIASYVNKL